MYCICENAHYLIIDPFWCASFKEQLEPLGKLDYIILTHEHYDHISGVNEIKANFGGEVLASSECASRIKSPTKNFSRYFDAYCTIQQGAKTDITTITHEYTTCAQKVFDGQLTIEWLGHTIDLHETPGHTPGSICILLDNMYLFSGDSLLQGGLPITRFPGGSRVQFETISMPYLRSLNKDIMVYPGHGDTFLLSEHEINQKNACHE